MTNPDVVKIVEGLTPDQRRRLLSFEYEPRQMGIGMTFLLPEMVHPVGVSHPVFGPHYSLTPLGLAVRAALKGDQ